MQIVKFNKFNLNS